MSQDITPNVRKIIKAMVSQTLVKCYQHGISSEDFYVAMQEEGAKNPDISVSELLNRTFEKLRESQ